LFESGRVYIQLIEGQLREAVLQTLASGLAVVDLYGGHLSFSLELEAVEGFVEIQKID